ncbi:MAG TPA: AI-2E family transporter [Candidatus Binataceae bacterium]|nr:AI-2E family transporter [Candidatus Binataceae bacterium]
MNGQEHSSLESWVALALVVLLAFACLLILLPFVSAAVWAAILCFSTWPGFVRLERLVKRRSLAAMIATLGLTAIIVTPFVIVGMTLSGNMADLVAAAQKLTHSWPSAPPSWIGGIPLVGGRLADYWTSVASGGIESFAYLKQYLPAAGVIALKTGRLIGDGILQIVLSLLISFVFYRQGETLADRLHRMVAHVAGDSGTHLLEVAGATVRAVVQGVFGTAALQGFLAGVGYLVAGVPGAIFLGFITFIVSPLPGGPTLVALPAAFWLYRQGWVGWAIFVVIWGMLVGALDNVVKPMLISRGGSTPVILILFGVLGGAFAFGLIGMFIGPTVLAVCYSLLDDWSSGPIPADPPLAAATPVAPSTAEREPLA